MFQCDAVDPADVNAVSTGVKRALATYGTQALTEMIKNCIAQDLSWKVSKYLEFVQQRSCNQGFIEFFKLIHLAMS